MFAKWIPASAKRRCIAYPPLPEVSGKHQTCWTCCDRSASGSSGQQKVEESLKNLCWILSSKSCNMSSWIWSLFIYYFFIFYCKHCHIKNPSLQLAMLFFFFLKPGKLMHLGSSAWRRKIENREMNCGIIWHSMEWRLGASDLQIFIPIRKICASMTTFAFNFGFRRCQKYVIYDRFYPVNTMAMAEPKWCSCVNIVKQYQQKKEVVCCIMKCIP